MKQRQSLVIVFSAIIVIAAAAVFLNSRTDNDITISFSETEDELQLSASFPDKYSKEVHDYVRSHLKMNDLSDLRYLEVKHYQTPDHKMRFNIKARNGYIKIVLDKMENSETAYRKLRDTCEGLKKVLGEG